jgi:uncharacterized membrane protein (DUF485 family)
MTPTLAMANAAGSAVPSRREAMSVESGASTWMNRLRFALLATPLVGVTVLSKFAIPPLGAQGIDLSLMLLPAAAIAGSICGGIRFEPQRLMVYVALLAVLGLVQIVQPDSFSPSSMLLLAALHLPYVFTVPHNGDRDRIIKFFLGIVTFFAWCGIAQYSLQFFVNARFLFPIEHFVPTSFIVQHFNKQAAVAYGSEVYRANGVFLLEPSFFSQVLAVAIVAELSTLGRVSRLAVFGIALLVSYSGTGMLVLAICLPIYAVTRRRWGLLLFGIIALIVMIPLLEYLHLDRFLSRLGEFGSTQSSGFARFVGGFYLFDQFLWSDPWRTLFGYGAGAFSDYASQSHYPVAEMALFKVVFEFGLIGALAYFGFLCCCLSTSSAPRILKLAVGITYLLNGIYTTFAHGLALGLLLWNSAPADGRAELPAKSTVSAALQTHRSGA